MDLFLQLNSKELPEDCPRSFDGLLQVFVCSYETFSGGLCQSSEPFSNASFVRVVSPVGAPNCLEAPSDELFDEQRIVGWTRHDDMPHFTELEHHGITLSDEQQDLQIDGEWAYPVTGDKLLGWADWMQGVDLVACPECGQAMSILFQIESCHGIPAMLADGGRGWVSQCSQHRDLVCFSWTCG